MSSGSSSRGVSGATAGSLMTVIRKPAAVKASVIACSGRCQKLCSAVWPPAVHSALAPVLQVVQHQGSRDVVERAVREGQRAAQPGHLRVRVVAEPPPGLLQHPGAFVEARHDGAPGAQRREQRTRAAASIEDPPPGHVPASASIAGRA